MLTETSDVSTEDFVYLKHGARELTLRLYRPATPGPHPLVIDIHGGAWNTGGPDECAARDRALAEAGVAAASLEFRHAGDGYPASLVDINYAVRWAKTHAGELDIDPDRIGLAGQSSGGHLAMLAAMRPADPRYAEIPLDRAGGAVDATVRCVGMLWPVINPLSRYRNALKQRASDDPPKWVGTIPEKHDTYWRTEAAMEEGNPLLALERGEKVLTPPAVWVQGRPDPVHDYRDPVGTDDIREPDRFVRNYRAAGGEIDIVEVAQANRGEEAVAPIVAFFRKVL